MFDKERKLLKENIKKMMVWIFKFKQNKDKEFKVFLPLKSTKK